MKVAFEVQMTTLAVVQHGGRHAPARVTRVTISIRATVDLVSITTLGDSDCGLKDQLLQWQLEQEK